ncbi:MAG: alpha/beta hydrolase [Candidatus Hydrogenedentes bacterium]|nr:alpha/beta hydrolase [Candidatus Hydrogenedentota bacterium]
MHVDSYGKGSTAFVGIHGWAGNHRTFQPLKPCVPRDATLYSVDLPGYGRSKRPKQWTLTDVANDIVELLPTLSKKPVTLLGYCGGGNLAMLAAKHAPERVARLVLLDPFAYMPLYFRVFTWGAFGRRAYMTTFGTSFGRRLTNTALSSKRTGKANLTSSFEKVDHAFILEVLRAFRDVQPCAYFGDLRMPIDLVYGRRSFGAVKHSVRLWQEIWPHARVIELHGAGHSPLVEATEQLAQMVFADTPQGRVKTSTSKRPARKRAKKRR